MSRVTKMFGSNIPIPQPNMTNVEDYPAYSLPIEERYVQTLMTNTFGQTFYADPKKLAADAGAIHDEMLAKDPSFAAKALVYARQKGFMRTSPIFGLVKLASVDRAEFAKAFNGVILTPNDLSDFTTILKSVRKGEGGRAVKRAAGDWLVRTLGKQATEDDEKDGQYWAIKYGAEKASDAYSLKDMIQTYHPRAGRKVELFDYLMGGRRKSVKDGARDMGGVNFGKLSQIEQFELLKSAENDEMKIQAITLGRLPHEVTTSFAGSNKAIWSAIVPNMPIFALLRNLATLERHGVLEENRKLIEEKFTNPEVISKSKILPFRFVEARKHVKAPWAQDALRDALELSFDAIPDIPGRTVVALDRSGSMGSFISTAAVFGVCLMKKAKNNGRFILFDDKADEVPVSMRDSILTQAESIHVRGGTNHSVVIDKLLREKDRVDQIVYITDEAQNTGTPLMRKIEEYRKTVNKQTKLFIVDVAPYQGSLVPGDRQTFHIFGWSDQVLQFIGLSAEGWGSQVKAIREGKV